MKKYFAESNLLESPRYILVTEHEWGSGARCLLLIYGSACRTDKSQSQRGCVFTACGSDACSSVFILVWILGDACPCLNSMVVEWLVFLTVKTEKLFKSHANHFESHIHKNSKRGLLKSRVNHFESWASSFLAVTKAVLGLQRSGCWLTFGWDVYTWETNAEWNSTFGTKKEKEKYPCYYCAKKSMNGNVWDAFW